MNYACEESRFLKDVENHEMIVLRDDGIYRHIRFKRPGTGCYHFDLLTWPGYLCYTGDMGTYVFQRLEDMFEFFRMNKRDFNHKPDRTLQTNPGYWSEKVQSDSRNRHGTMEFSDEKFREVLKGVFDSQFEADAPDGDATEEEKSSFEEKKVEAWEAVEDEILSCDNLEHEGMRAVGAFEHDGLEFTDFWDHNFEEFTLHFVWCCYALAWGIQKYDELRTNKEG